MRVKKLWILVTLLIIASFVFLRQPAKPAATEARDGTAVGARGRCGVAGRAGRPRRNWKNRWVKRWKLP